MPAPKRRLFYFNRFSLEDFKKSFPDLTEFDWYEQNLPDNIYDFLSDKYFSIADGTKDAPKPIDFIAVNTVTDDFYDFLYKCKINPKCKFKGIEDWDIDSQMVAYFTTKNLTDKFLLKNAKEKNMLNAYTVLFIPAFLAVGVEEDEDMQTVFKAKLNENDIKNLKFFLENIYGKGNVYLSGNFVDYYEVDKYYATYLANAKKYFETGESNYIPGMETLHEATETAVACAFIPFVVRSEVKNVLFTIEELTSMFANIKYSPQLLVDLTSPAIAAVGRRSKSLSESKFGKEFYKKHTNIILVDMQIVREGIEEFLLDMVTYL